MDEGKPNRSKLDRWLVPEWRQCWRWFSTHALAIGVALQAAWLEAPPDIRAAMPVWLIHVLTIVVLVLGFIGRLIPQRNRQAESARNPSRRSTKGEVP